MNSWLYWALGSALFAGLTAIFAKAGVESISSHLATAIRTTVALVFCWALALATTPLRQITTVPAKAWTFLILSGLATGLSWVCYFQALKLGPVSKVAPIDKLSVVVAMGLAMALFGERLNARELAGAALIVSGALVLAWK